MRRAQVGALKLSQLLQLSELIALFDRCFWVNPRGGSLRHPGPSSLHLVSMCCLISIRYKWRVRTGMVIVSGRERNAE